MNDIAILRKRLSEAQDALHRLMIGELEVTVSVGGFGATTYAQTDINKLKTYISELKSQIASLGGGKRRGPLYIRF